MSHSVYNHGQLGYSAACYVTYNPEKHTPTQFIAPFCHPINGDILQYEPPDIEEGDLIFFPSYLLHLLHNLIKLMMKELYYHLT